MLAALDEVHRPPTADRHLLPEPGEAAARRRLERWLRGPVNDYADRRDRLDDPDGTSRLSPYLRFGLVSPVEAAVRAPDDAGGRRFRTELAWRDFHAHQLFRHPDLAARPPRSDLDRAWGRDEGGLEAWRAGRTGYPVVDAAMRQLAETGWIHNRARMIAASFLTKHLLVDWREGEAHFRRHLVDGDIASNVGNWQWIAAVGVDAQPYFRIFNPSVQGERFDPDGTWVRHWVPELGGVPSRYVHRPWEMPPDVQLGARCRIGVDYPAPIVDHAEARSRALSAFGTSARDGPPGRARVR
jgi:deoxyribodipyrimidine photo-lyase